MKAMILSGGRGKRLRPVTDSIPKPLIKINGKPLIEWKINYLKKFGIKDIIICSGYKGKKIENYIKKKKNFGCNIEYSVETSPLGTGGAIKKAIKNIVGDSFIVLNGDIITNINLKKMMVKTNSIAAISIFVAVFLDGMDGKIARITNAVSDFGKDYDSLSDLVSFGVAPALLFYLWGNNHLLNSILLWEKTAWLVSFFYIAATALRLARFNNQLHLKYNPYFSGLPSPAAATLVSVIVWQCELLLLAPIVSFAVLIFSIVVSAAMMVSKVPYYGFKNAQSARRIPFAKTVMIPLIFILILLEPPLVLSVMAISYLFSGPVSLLLGSILKTIKTQLSSSQSNRSD